MKIWFIPLLALFPSIMLPAYAEEAVVIDDDFVVEKYVTGICCGITTIAFMGDDLLVLQKTTGQVHRIRDGVEQAQAVVDESVTHQQEQGMLGITTVGNKVYLYFTESTQDGGLPISKRAYSYDWDGDKLVNRTLVKDLPQTQGYHNGGAMVTGLDGQVYLVVGDTGRYGKLQNKPTGEPNDTSVILRIAPPGPYYAMGVRNSFGLAIDPITGKLWDTENGDEDFDEINLVEENFNSGWMAIMGPANKTQLAELPGYPGYTYSDPEFSWEVPVAPTGLAFINSKPFEKYGNSLFVVDCNRGNLYRFELNQDRDGFVFDSPELADKVVNFGEPLNEILFGKGFGCATDIEAGPDGLLYIASLSQGTIYRIMPKFMPASPPAIPSYVEYVVYAVVAVAAAAAAVASAAYLKRRTRVK